jgi:NhaP-type Na+/H+ or K+/H+ antiporter
MPSPASEQALATDPQRASAYLAHAVLSFNEQLERIGELAAVIAIGLLLSSVRWEQVSWPFAALVLLGIRPAAVALGLIGTSTPTAQRRLIGWFGIRGVGSIFYLAYALNHGVEGAVADTLVAATVSVVVASIVVHGISVTPLMRTYRSRRRDEPAR